MKTRLRRNKTNKLYPRFRGLFRRNPVGNNNTNKRDRGRQWDGADGMKSLPNPSENDLKQHGGDANGPVTGSSEDEAVVIGD